MSIAMLVIAVVKSREKNILVYRNKNVQFPSRMKYVNCHAEEGGGAY